MSDKSTNALDRYIGMADAVVQGAATVEQWMEVFAPDAVVEIFAPRIVSGRAELTRFYREFVADFIETKHFWNSEVLSERRLRATWAAVIRTPDGAVLAVSGVEHANVDEEGRITDLRNAFTVPPPAPRA